jgi:hypothetical protein
MRKRKKYITVPRMISSSSEVLTAKIRLQSRSIAIS